MANSATSETRSQTLESVSSDASQRIYEISFLLSPAVKDEALSEATASLKKAITDTKGIILAEGDLEYIDLAYSMHKTVENVTKTFDQAHFGWIKFEASPEMLPLLRSMVDRMESVIRFLIISAVRENTVISKKPLSKVLRREKKEKIDFDAEPVVEESADGAVVEEKIDAAIEQMVESKPEESALTEEKE